MMSTFHPASPHPLRDQLPGVYAEDTFAGVFADGLDTMQGPVLTVLDCLDAYFRAGLAPVDFLDWIGEWVGAELQGLTSEPVRREAVGAAMVMHRRRGTAQGLAAAVRLAFGVTPEITESGGATWSPRPRGAFPGEPVPFLRVVVRVPDPAAFDVRRLESLVGAARPVHVPFTVEVLKERSDNR
ncbi:MULTISPECIES: phage tail protein [Streptomyces]|uniref:Phage tail protein n=1 Tax=Streptomyces cadmiisoli TaxID=2184053 RepID=A0A2Z4ISX9_9ACTN|nr:MULTISPECIES: phage tail protein [Streptomyces]AWW35867.1 phage tail protein [Streptomyces cadmiisoli]KOV51761.1 tail protein [Streptomyces sp. AS58]